MCLKTVFFTGRQEQRLQYATPAAFFSCMRIHPSGGVPENFPAASV